MTRADLEALARRCESEPASRKLDLAIEIAVKGMLAKQTYCPWYTLYLDAAVSLVADRTWEVGTYGVHGRAIVTARGKRKEATARTPALALCAAALRARAMEAA